MNEGNAVKKRQDINRAVRLMNQAGERARLREILRRESGVVRAESLRVLEEFESLNDEDKD